MDIHKREDPIYLKFKVLCNSKLRSLTPLDLFGIVMIKSDKKEVNLNVDKKSFSLKSWGYFDSRIMNMMSIMMNYFEKNLF